MKTAAQVAVLLVLSLGAGAAGAFLAVDRAGAGSGPAPAAPTSDFARELGLLREAVESQRRAVDDVAFRVAALEVAPRAAVGAIAPEPSAAAGSGGAPGPAAADAPAGGLTADAAFERLLAEDFESDEAGEVFWQAVRDAGLMDEVLARFRARAEERPNDAGAQLDLGIAYIQALEGAAGPMQGMLASRADAAFDAALALDEDHLDARMWKAISLSFWPPVFGKQSEAIQQFEILIEKQKNYPAQPGHANAYVLLGNMYLQQGAQEKALAAWKSGAALFPDDPQLAEKIASAEAP